MYGKFTENALPSVAAIQAEAARIESMILAAVQREESSHLSPGAFMQMQMCRAELQAYLAARRVSHPVDALESEVVSKRGNIMGMVGNRQMTGWLTTRTARESRGKSRACDSGSAAGTRIL